MFLSCRLVELRNPPMSMLDLNILYRSSRIKELYLHDTGDKLENVTHLAECLNQPNDATGVLETMQHDQCANMAMHCRFITISTPLVDENMAEALIDQLTEFITNLRGFSTRTRPSAARMVALSCRTLFDLISGSDLRFEFPVSENPWYEKFGWFDPLSTTFDHVEHCLTIGSNQTSDLNSTYLKTPNAKHQSGSTPFRPLRTLYDLGVKFDIRFKFPVSENSECQRSGWFDPISITFDHTRHSSGPTFVPLLLLFGSQRAPQPTH
ncbi:hypothetical protein Ddc_19472 [Ditylenchus destructor]|nr:hypothetical protein Ddc_19472 [Ditylenchus destructor]